jgi:hypothetical protein
MARGKGKRKPKVFNADPHKFNQMVIAEETPGKQRQGRRSNGTGKPGR